MSSDNNVELEGGTEMIESPDPADESQTSCEEILAGSVDCPDQGYENTRETMKILRRSTLGKRTRENTGDIEGGDHSVLPDQRPETVTDPQTPSIVTIKQKFQDELDLFREERKKNIWEIPREDITLDYNTLISEWKIVEKDWRSRKEVKEHTFFSEFSLRFMIGFFFTVIPNCLIVLDYRAAYEYLNGTYYPQHHWSNVSQFEAGHQCETREMARTCFEKDPVFGYLTLALTFQAGLFWSFLMIYKYWTHLHLRENKPETCNNKPMFLVFLPAALLGILTFPIQLLVISLLSCLNDQEQWINLTVKVGIAEGLFNAHFQWLLQTFIFLYQADRQPTTFQLLAAFGSLVFLAYSRVESILLERGGHRMTPGQKSWWMVRYIPYCAVNCGYKLLSISLIITMLRFNTIWLYGTVIIIWFLLQTLFNEGCLSKRHYYLFQGAGIHAISYTHIPDWIKLIEAKKNPKENILWVTKLSLSEIRRNIIFQNTIYVVVNSAVLLFIWILSRHSSSHGLQIFWPFTPDYTYKLKDAAVFPGIDIMIPLLIMLGIILIVWVIYEERNRNEIMKNPECSDFPSYPGWKQDSCSEDGWHKYKVDDNNDDGVQGFFNQIFYSVINIWESFIDNSLH